MHSYTEKVAVITGAASGIGAGLAEHAASLKMRLVLADVETSGLTKSWSDPNNSLVLRTNVAEFEDVNALAEAAFERFGRVDYLFNNAGLLRSGRTWELGASDWENSHRVNVGGVINGIRAFVPRMISSGQEAAVINTASVGGFFSSPLMAAYSSTKFAVVAITEALEHELRDLGSQVRAAVLAPGPVKTSLLSTTAQSDSSELIAKMIDMTAKRGADPVSIAKFTFKALEDRQFWIVPQPESLDERLVKRTANVLARKFD